MGVDHYPCDVCGMVRHSDSLVRCNCCGDVRACEEDCTEKAGEFMTSAAFEKLQERESREQAQAEAAYAHEKACLVAEMAGQPRPAVPEIDEVSDDDDDEEEEEEKDKNWYCESCAEVSVPSVRPTASNSEIVKHLLKKLGMEYKAAEAEVIRAKILREIEQEQVRANHKARVEAKNQGKEDEPPKDDNKPGHKRKAV